MGQELGQALRRVAPFQYRHLPGHSSWAQPPNSKRGSGQCYSCRVGARPPNHWGFGLAQSRHLAWRAVQEGGQLMGPEGAGWGFRGSHSRADGRGRGVYSVSRARAASPPGKRQSAGLGSASGASACCAHSGLRGRVGGVVSGAAPHICSPFPYSGKHSPLQRHHGLAWSHEPHGLGSNPASAARHPEDPGQRNVLSLSISG